MKLPSLIIFIFFFHILVAQEVDRNVTITVAKQTDTSVTAVIGNQFDGYISKEKLFSEPYISMVTDRNDLKIISFTFYRPSIGTAKLIHCKGDRMSDEVLEYIFTKTHNGSSIFFKDIKALSDKNDTLLLNSIALKLIEKRNLKDSIPWISCPYFYGDGTVVKINTDSLNLNKKLHFGLNNSNIRVSQFAVVIPWVNCCLVEHYTKQDTLDERHMELINSLKSGDHFHITDILAVDQNGAIYRTPIIIFQIE